MVLDLEHELLRAARALCAWRDHVRPHTEDVGFRCDDVLAFIVETRAQRAFPRIAHPLLAHVVEGLAESLVSAGLFERAGTGRYTVSERAATHLDGEPAYLAEGRWSAEPEALPLDECTAGDPEQASNR